MKTENQEEYILNLVYQLPVENQIRLALVILQGNEDTYHFIEESPEIEKELFHRIKEYERGDIKGQPWKEVIKDIQQRFKNH